MNMLKFHVRTISTLIIISFLMGRWVKREIGTEFMFGMQGIFLPMLSDT